MRQNLVTYACDGRCGTRSSATGHDTAEQAWDHARRAGWVSVAAVVDGTGHVGTLHYCRADAIAAGVAQLRPAVANA